ncbi:MAG: hypothetical protein GY711_05665 [bacterium]|nr:hypothetical protein [bacterium]
MRIRLCIAAATAIISVPGKGFAQTYYVMFEERQNFQSINGTSEVIRQSEGAGLGASGENVAAIFVWFFDQSDPNAADLPGAASKAPGTEQISVKFRIESPVFPEAVATAGLMPTALEEVTLYDGTGTRLLAQGGTSDTFELIIDPGQSRYTLQAKILLYAHEELSAFNDDAPLEEMQFVIDALHSDDTSITLTPGWHMRRFLVEDSAGSVDDPPTQSVVCSTVCSIGGCPVILGPPNGEPTDLTLQIGHTSPWTSKDRHPTLPICAVSGQSGHCQESIKAFSEGQAPNNDFGYMGYRFQDRDSQSDKHTICGCQAAIDRDDIWIEFEVTGTAIAAADPANVDPATEDYVLRYVSQSRSFDIPVTSSQVFLNVKRNDYNPKPPTCFTDRTPPGFGLRAVMHPNTDSADYETIIIRTKAVWLDFVGGPVANVGWNDVAKFIVEEGS